MNVRMDSQHGSALQLQPPDPYAPPPTTVIVHMSRQDRKRTPLSHKEPVQCQFAVTHDQGVLTNVNSYRRQCHHVNVSDSRDRPCQVRHARMSKFSFFLLPYILYLGFRISHNSLTLRSQRDPLPASACYIFQGRDCFSKGRDIDP